MALHLWETLKDSIVVYTGLSPAAFFTLLALVVAAYYVVSSLFVAPSQEARSLDNPPQPPPEPVHLGEITSEVLKLYDGSDPSKPLLMAIKGQIYDVSQSRMFYGPGGPYALFAGKDASRALAKMSFDEKDLTGDISGLSPHELETLQDWEYKFMGKYTKVGSIKSVGPTTGDTSAVPEVHPEHAGRDVLLVPPANEVVDGADKNGVPACTSSPKGNDDSAPQCIMETGDRVEVLDRAPSAEDTNPHEHVVYNGAKSEGLASKFHADNDVPPKYDVHNCDRNEVVAAKDDNAPADVVDNGDKSEGLARNSIAEDVIASGLAGNGLDEKPEEVSVYGKIHVSE